MYAAGHIFWQTDVARLLVLDTSTMEFSEHGVPWEIVSTSWSIGELRDCKGCLVCLQGLNSSFGKDGFIVEEPLRLEVWALKKEDKQVKFCWKCEKGVRVSEMLPEDDARVYKVHKVINGLALIGCTKGSYAIDLQSMTLLAKFESGGDIYPYQMSWPPAVLAAATSVVSRHLGANLSNEDCARIPSKNMDGREGTSSGGSESEVHISQTPLSLEQHDIGEKSSQDLHGCSARIQPMEKDPCHDELTLQTAGVFPSESCDRDILEDKSETDSLPKNTTEDTEMLEQQHSDKAHIEVSCADKMSEVLYDDNNTLKKNTICGGKVAIECHLALLHNKSSEARSNAISSPMQKVLLLLFLAHWPKQLHVQHHYSLGCLEHGSDSSSRCRFRSLCCVFAQTTN
ncbi:uncharacterized protein [Aegilops tauschii subsp. strangulata]|uniref:Uncharacterized protein n=2 Tax=Aegilops tauschii subsp. strangulata TaxID=200361 RepID=A0A453NCJ9_AEGTS|nr:uncharacterized protein LOC109756638 isoform X1 [Aegilops tauschii subsp. strangulata]